MDNQTLALLAAIITVGVAIAGHLRSVSRGLRADNAQTRTELKGEIDKLDGRIGKTRTDLTGEITAVRDNLQSQIAAVRDNLQSQIAAAREEAKADNAHTRSELKGELSEVRADLRFLTQQTIDVLAHPSGAPASQAE